MTTRFRRRQARKPPVMDDDASLTKEVMTADIQQNEAFVKQEFRRCTDLVCRSIHSHGDKPKQLIVYLGTLADDSKVSEQIVKALAAHQEGHFPEEAEEWDGELLPVSKQMTTSKWSDIIRSILNGYAIIFTDGLENAICIAMKNTVHRALEEPSSEPTIRGSKEGFIESIQVNLGLLRKYIRTSRLKMESFNVGEIAETKILVAYIEGRADESVLDQIRKKISDIKIDGLLESGYIEEMIINNPFPLFPLTIVTERPDVVAGALMEGRVAILVDNTPFVLVVPVTFWSGLQASEDYYLRYPIAIFTRWIRFVFLFIAVFAPSIFVAVTTFNYEMIPTSLLLSIASAREPVPFPIMLEALLMELMFEALREAGIRLPRPIGQTVSIVGALVIGQAAVQAGIISAPTVIVVSTTGIAAFLIPRFNFANGVRLLRFPMILLAGSLGLYGIALGFLAILLHVVQLKSFGVPYLAPVAPFSSRALKDVFLRAPIDGRIKAPQYGKEENN